MKIFKIYLILLFILIISCTSTNVRRNKIKVHFVSLGNDFAAVDMVLYDNKKFELKTAVLEMHGNEEYLLELKGTWTVVKGYYILEIEKFKKEKLMEYLFTGWEHEESGFEIISENKVKFPVDREFLIINNVKCQKQ